MFPLFQTAAATLGAGFLLVTGLIISDSFDEEIDEVFVVEEVVSTTTEQVDLTEDTVGTTTESVAGETEIVAEAEINPGGSNNYDSIEPVTIESPIDQYSINDASQEDQVENLIADTRAIEVATSAASSSIGTETTLEEIELEELITEEGDCFSSDVRSLFINPGQCLREIRTRLF